MGAGKIEGDPVLRLVQLAHLELCASIETDQVLRARGHLAHAVQMMQAQTDAALRELIPIAAPAEPLRVGEFLADKLAPIIRGAPVAANDRAQFWGGFVAGLFGQCCADLGSDPASLVFETISRMKP